MAANSSINTILLNQGVVQSDGVTQLTGSKGTNGQILIGATAGVPAWNNITSSNGSIAITNGANSINLENSGGGGFTPSTKPCFSAYLPSNVAVSGSYINSYGYATLLGSTVALTELYDQNNNFNPGNGAGTGCSFLAPVSGLYKFTVQVAVNANTGGSSVWVLIIGKTNQPSPYPLQYPSNLTFCYWQQRPSSNVVVRTLTFNMSFFVYLTAGNSITSFYIYTFDLSVDAILGSGSSNLATFINGYLVE